MPQFEVKLFRPEPGNSEHVVADTWKELERIGVTEKDSPEKGISAVTLFRRGSELFIYMRHKKINYLALSVKRAFRLLKEIPDKVGPDYFWDAMKYGVFNAAERWKKRAQPL